MQDLTKFDAEVENYGQFLDLPKPKSTQKFRLLCHCPKCGQTHTCTYNALSKDKNRIYCYKHYRAINAEKRYGPGITSCQQLQSTKDKIRASKDEHLGPDWGAKWYEEQKKRNLEILGVENSAFDPNHMRKCYETMAKNFGSVEKAYAIRQKHLEETAENEYGSYETYTKIRLNNQLDSLRSQYNDDSIDSIKNIPALREERFNDYITAIQYFPNVHIFYKNGTYNFKCAVCGYETPVDYSNRLYKCPECNKSIKPRGQISAINAFLKQQGQETQLDARDIFSGMIFDIYIPEHKIGFDLISTSTHSNIGRFDLQKKSQECEKFGITYIGLMEDYWYTKPETVKSKILDILKLSKREIDAFQCEIRTIDVDTYNNFCEDNHLWGKCSASLKLGMFYQGELISVVGLQIPRYLKEYNWEIIRFCMKNGTYVSNALHAFIIWMTKMHTDESIVYYHDMRWPDNTENAMEYLRDTVPSVYYWKGDGKLESWSLNKRTWIEKKEDFDYNGDLSTRLNLLKEGYNIMYDCGYKVYIYD